MKSTGAPSSNELQRLDYNTGYQDSSHSNACLAMCPIHRVWLITACSWCINNLSQVFTYNIPTYIHYIDDLVQDCGISSVSVIEIPHSCTEPSISTPSCRARRILDFLLAQLQNYAFFQSAYIELYRKHCSNLLAQLVVLLALGCWAMGNVKPCRVLTVMYEYLQTYKNLTNRILPLSSIEH